MVNVAELLRKRKAREAGLISDSEEIKKEDTEEVKECDDQKEIKVEQECKED